MSLDYNPLLKGFLERKTDGTPARGRIVAPDTSENIPWQTRPAPPTDYEDRLADALIACFEDGIDALPVLVARLNEMGIRTPDDQPWTEANFEPALTRLGA